MHSDLLGLALTNYGAYLGDNSSNLAQDTFPAADYSISILIYSL